uniref:Uncharacterized protein n=1 Tax=Arundo donax TaxID=35708 RepID=A0A0A9HFF5_ARUDO
MTYDCMLLTLSHIAKLIPTPTNCLYLILELSSLYYFASCSTGFTMFSCRNDYFVAHLKRKQRYST